MSVPGPLRRVLVANRGEIAMRLVRACVDEGIEAVVAVSEADQDSMAARLAHDVVHIGPPAPHHSYLRVEQIVAAALLADCDGVHPGYGFLSERPELAEACARHELTFVGPSAEAIRRGGDKVVARSLARSAGIPIGPGTKTAHRGGHHLAAVIATAEQIGYPILLKAAAGGGGRGMVRVDSAEDLADRFLVASNEAQAAFGDGRLYLERLVENARHVEVQLLADTHGNIVHLGDRDCSVQRRFQKVVEEAPATGVPDDLRRRLAEAAVALGRDLDYCGAGTVEFLVDLDQGDFSFLEINTRLQVEHPVTEAISGIDIVREQLRIAGGQPLSMAQDDVVMSGHAIECRINAESAMQGFAPSPGTITTWAEPNGDHIRVDTHGFEGYEIPPYYDSLLAKLIVSGVDRAAAIKNMLAALAGFNIQGVDTTIDFHKAVVGHPDFAGNAITTSWLEGVLMPEILPLATGTE